MDRGERPVWTEACAKYMPRSAEVYDPWRTGVGLVWIKEVKEESNIRTVS